jgi:hypothetical protein
MSYYVYSYQLSIKLGGKWEGSGTKRLLRPSATALLSGRKAKMTKPKRPTGGLVVNHMILHNTIILGARFYILVQEASLTAVSRPVYLQPLQRYAR